MAVTRDFLRQIILPFLQATGGIAQGIKRTAGTAHCKTEGAANHPADNNAD
ncbi:TPA: hypothetical protein ACGEY7_004324 [Salmonella enterica]